MLLKTFILGVGLAGFAGASNLILNGDFSLGYTDFSSGYTQVAANGTVFTGPGDYALTTNPSTGFTNGYQSYTPYENPTGSMLLVDGLGAGTDAWSEDDISVVSGTTYTFSAYVADADTSGYSGNPAILELLANGSVVGSSYTVPNAPGDWGLWTFNYTPTSSGLITLSIQDINATPYAAGNDFSLDNLSLSSPSGSGSPVPEPSSIAVCLLGLLGMGVGGALRQGAMQRSYSVPLNKSVQTAAAGRSRNPIGFAVLLLTLAIPAFGSPVYDAAADFSAASNPNGQWSYLVNGSLLTQGQSTCNGHTGIACWDNNSSIPTYTSVSDNLTGSPIWENGSVDLPPGELNLDPEANTVTVVWTAPSSGMWSVSGFFSGLDMVSPSHPAEILLDSSTTLFSTTISGYGDLADFSFDRYLSAGDTLDFEVGTANGGYYLGTGFDATISAAATSAVPEPGGLALFGAGLLLLAGFVRRRQTNRGAKD